MADFARIQLDAKSLLAADYVPLLLNLSSDDEQVKSALEQLQNWDLQERQNSIATSIFEIFYMHLAEATLADELGDIRDVYLFDGNAQLMFFHHLSQQPAATWWDNTNTETSETRDQIMLQSLVQAIDWLETRLGPNMDQWTWSSLHTITFISTPVGRFGLPFINGAVNRGPFPVDGGNSVISATDWAWEEPAVSSGGVTFRFLADLSALDTSLGIHATGQSGHPFSPHYDDFIELWLNGEYHPLFFSQSTVEQNAVDHLILTPR
jgi:penicillin amidase